MALILGGTQYIGRHVAFNLAGPRPTWAEFMTILGAQNPVRVGARSGGVR